MFETIIVPLDGSELAESALELAHELQKKFDSRLVLLRTIEPESYRLAQAPTFFETPGAAAANIEVVHELTAQARDEAALYLNALAERLGRDNIDTVVLEETPAEAIVNLARERDASLIVMSSHGRGGLQRIFFGSVADSVLKESTIPVLLVKHSSES